MLLVPRPAVHSVDWATRRRSIRIGDFEIFSVRPADINEPDKKLLRLIIARRLQHGIHQVVHAVQSFVVVARQVSALRVLRR